MADRTRYLVAYDIRHRARLRRVHRVATDYGEPLQYSVFVCDLTAVELISLREKLLTEMKTSEDSVSIFDLGAPASRGVECIEFLGVRRSLPDDGPAIW
ncbi:MAG: CRISPR-associated endonuclease Cas2 [Solirubrobacteraceae bacterium]